jgi:uncharacterized membrane protein YfcA
MQQFYAAGAALVAIAATAAYLYRPTERVPVSGSVAFLLWGVVGLQGGDVERVTESGSTVAAPIPDELRFVAVALSVLSLLAVVLWSMGVYPPEREGADEPGTERYAMDPTGD